MELLRTESRLDERFHQCLYYPVAAQLHVKHRLAVVNPVAAQSGTGSVSVAHKRIGMVDKASFERSRHYLVLVLHKSAGALCHEFPYHTGTHIHHFLVIVGHILVHYAPENVFSGVLIEESEQQTLGLAVSENLQFVSVLDVHYLITYVVSRLNEVHQRMAGVPYRLAGCRQPYYAQFIGYTAISVCLRTEEAVLAVRTGAAARERILHHTRKQRVCHDKTAYAASPETVGEQTEHVGVALKTYDVVPHPGAHKIFHTLSRTVGKERLDGFLAAMAERRVAHVVGETCRADDGSYLLKQRSGKCRVAPDYLLRHIIAQRHSHTRHFKAVGEPVVHEDAARKRKHLCLVLHAAERCGEYQTVVVALELRPVVMPPGVPLLLPEAFVGNQFVPVHSHI